MALNKNGIRLHEDDAMFQEALAFTAAETAFSARLIEKDYYCSVLLEYLASVGDLLVFKGGTCLAKIHTDFYRMSEDLDFVIPMPMGASRKERSSKVVGIKNAIVGLTRHIPTFSVAQPLTGSNNSTQYISIIHYISAITHQAENIKLEIGLREPLLTPVLDGTARTILLDPISDQPIIQPISLKCLSLNESLAEKFRAALSRREAAIRDFLDIDYAIRKLNFNPADPGFIELVRRKLAVPGNDRIDVSAQRLAALRRQIDTELRSVLRPKDFEDFNLERVFAPVAALAEKILGTQ